MKDLRKLGRPLDKTIIVDNLEESFRDISYYNGIKVNSWIDDPNDQDLDILVPFLKAIVIRQVEDVRVLMKNYKQKVEKCLEDTRYIPEFTKFDLIL